MTVAVNSFDLLDETFRSNGPEAVFELLIARARDQKNYRELFAIRIMHVRHRLGLPLIETEPVSEYSEVERPVYEQALREAARETGELFLADGDIVSAWPYFRAIDQPGPIAAAIENASGGENLDRLIEIAFQEGVNPRKGFELILEHRGICNAITWFGSIRQFGSRQECLPAADPDSVPGTGEFPAGNHRVRRRRAAIHRECGGAN